MALDFPSSPTNGQVYEQYVYDTSLPGWRSKGGAVAATYTSDAAPSGAVKGDMWYRTSDGTTFVYVVDANTSQWVEIRSEISTSKVGLIPIIPTSVTVSSGTASVDGKGVVSFSSADTITIKNLFSGAYTYYRFILSVTSSATDADVMMQLAKTGISNLNAGWHWGRYMVYAGPNAGASFTANTSGGMISRMSAGGGISTGDLINPGNTGRKGYNTLSADNDFMGFFGGRNSSSTAYEDVYLYRLQGGSFTGTFQVYGYN